MKLYYIRYETLLKNTLFFNIVAKTVQIFDIPWHKLFNPTPEIISSNLSVNHFLLILFVISLITLKYFYGKSFFYLTNTCKSPGKSLDSMKVWLMFPLLLFYKLSCGSTIPSEMFPG